VGGQVSTVESSRPAPETKSIFEPYLKGLGRSGLWKVMRVRTGGLGLLGLRWSLWFQT
jgi:hypothetical protein